MRKGDVKTEIPCKTDPNIQTESVVAKMPDGSWVGWAYYFGEDNLLYNECWFAVEWMKRAYDVTLTIEEKLVTVRTFSKTA